MWLCVLDLANARGSGKGMQLSAYSMPASATSVAISSLVPLSCCMPVSRVVF